MNLEELDLGHSPQTTRPAATTTTLDVVNAIDIHIKQAHLAKKLVGAFWWNCRWLMIKLCWIHSRVVTK